jgi:branched-chain amino acid transport system substrate-binding protein
MILTVVMLIVGLGIGTGIGYVAMPPKVTTETVTVTVEKKPMANYEIHYGLIASSTTALENAKPYVDNILLPDFNNYLKLLGYDTTLKIFLDNANEAAATHLEKVQSFKAQGILVFEGGGWSSFASAALPYVNQNNMLMWSSSSTSPLLRIADDNLFRMCPDDTVQAPAIAEMLWSWGAKAIVVIQRGDAWADGIFNILNVEYPKKGGVILERIRYAAEVTEFSSYLQTAETKIKDAIPTYGKDHVAVEIISFDTDGVTLLSQAKDFPTIYDLKWFGSDGTSLSSRFPNEVPEQANHLSIYSTLAAPAASPKYTALYDRYYPLLKLPFGYYTSCEYDILTVVIDSILQAQSYDPKDIIPLQMDISNYVFGASGWCRLNEAGDRAAGNYDIWGYKTVGNAVENVKFGLYDGVTGKVSWDLAQLGYTPPGP